MFAAGRLKASGNSGVAHDLSPTCSAGGGTENHTFTSLNAAELTPLERDAVLRMVGRPETRAAIESNHRIKAHADRNTKSR